MQVKVDYSTEDKDLYSIYYRKWSFCKWIRIGKDYEYLSEVIRKAYQLKEENEFPPIYNGFLIKVDYSIESKRRGNDITIPGCYALYKRKSIFHKWKEGTTYASFDFALWDLEHYYKDEPPFYI